MKRQTTLEQRNKKIATAIAARVGVACVLCEETVYTDWGSRDELNIETLINHFNTKHESEAAIVALTQDITNIKDIVQKARLNKSDKAHSNTISYKLYNGRVFHLPHPYYKKGIDSWGATRFLCAYYTYPNENKNLKKKWGDVPHKERCKACAKASVV